LKPVKGILPVPREVLNKRQDYKATPEWLAKATPEPSSWTDMERVPTQLRQQTEYKHRMAGMRRKNLREGVTELYDRVVETEQRTDTAKEHQLLRDIKALNAPPRHDDKWTSLNVSKPVRDALRKKSTKRDESETERARRKADVEKRIQDRVDDRLQNLHTLYLHAKDFIINEQQLDAEIDRVFGSEDLPMTWAGGRKSVWTLGHPAGTTDLIGLKPKTGMMAAQANEINQAMQERMMRIAGKLTGGKIQVPEDIKKKKSEYSDLNY
jgi:hypothetical protein